VSFHATILYVVMVFAGQMYMKNRPPFNLRRPLALWNLPLSFFSLCGFLRTAPDLWHVLQGEHGFYRSVCVRDSLNPPTAFWAYLFTLSKLLELGDTAFIVLRKTPLIFLHWYHHSTVLIFSWLCYPQAEPIFRYVGVMNYFVHSVMYFYYGLKARQVKIPQRWSIAITILQISQMAWGLFVNFYAMYAKSMGWECARSYAGFKVLMLMYLSYLLLFGNYFYKAYIRKAITKGITKGAKGDWLVERNLGIVWTLLLLACIIVIVNSTTYFPVLPLYVASIILPLHLLFCKLWYTS